VLSSLSTYNKYYTLYTHAEQQKHISYMGLHIGRCVLCTAVLCCARGCVYFIFRWSRSGFALALYTSLCWTDWERYTKWHSRRGSGLWCAALKMIFCDRDSPLWACQWRKSAFCANHNYICRTLSLSLVTFSSRFSPLRRRAHQIEELTFVLEGPQLFWSAPALYEPR
jgi:hypothetical protein